MTSVPAAQLADPASIRQVFIEKARRAGFWALEYLRNSAGQPAAISLRFSALLQALTSCSLYVPEPEPALRLVLGLNEAMISSARWVEWEPYVVKCLELARRSRDERMEFELLQALADARALRGDWGPAMPVLQEAMRLHEAVETGWERPFTRYAECRLGLGQPALARLMLESALEIAGVRQDRLAQTNILGQLGRIFRVEGEMATAIGCFERALALSRELDRPNLVLSNLVHLGGVHCDCKRHEEALACLAEATWVCRSLGEVSGEGVS